MTKLWKCGVCGAEYSREIELRSHVAGSMEQNNGDHPHWSDLPVSHDDLSEWSITRPSLSDFS